MLFAVADTFVASVAVPANDPVKVVVAKLLVDGLYIRPGSIRLGSSPLTNVQSGGSWFHYYRDETEGSYIGQVAADGRVRVWSCNDGTEKDVWYHTDNSAYDGSNSDHTAITT